MENKLEDARNKRKAKAKEAKRKTTWDGRESVAWMKQSVS